MISQLIPSVSRGNPLGAKQVKGENVYCSAPRGEKFFKTFMLEQLKGSLREGRDKAKI